MLLENIKGYNYLIRLCKHKFNKYIRKICGSNTSSIGLLTCLTKFKPVDVINLTSWFDQINVGTAMVIIENSHGSIANIKSSSSSYIPKWKS